MYKVNYFTQNAKIYRSNNNIENPLVSVIMPTYCRGDNGYLERTIKSVLSQTYKLYELIIVDDGSEDNTRNLVMSYLDKCNRIVYIRNNINSGLPAIRVNQGLAIARGRFICYQFDDDVWTPNALEKLVNAINIRNEPCLVYGVSECIDKDTGNKIVLGNQQYNYYKLLNSNFIANNSVIHHKCLIDKYGMYNMHLLMRRVCDWELWLRWGREVRFYNIDDVVSKVEINSEGSLGKSVDYLHISYRKVFNWFDKSNFLLNCYEGFQVDSLEHILKDKEYNHIYCSQIAQWHLNVNMNTENSDALHYLNVPIQVIATKCDYDSTVAIMIENFIEALGINSRYAFIPEYQLSIDDIDDNSFLLLCRATTQNTLDLVNCILKEKRNVTIMYFIDDDLLNIYKLGKEFDYIRPGSQMHFIITELMRKSHRIVAFSDIIYTNAKIYNNRVGRMSTNILRRYIYNRSEYSKNKNFRVLFAGGSARKKELSHLAEDIIQLSEDSNRMIEFNFWGYIPPHLAEIIGEKIKFKEYSSSYYAYLNELSRKKFDLFLSPLMHNDLNNSKSPIKHLESVVCGSVGIFSDSPVYKNVIDMKTGIIVSNSSSWRAKIEEIHDMNYSDRATIFNMSVKYVNRYFATENQVNSFMYNLNVASLSRKLNKKTIIYVSHSAYLGGAENHLLRHAKLMIAEGFNVEYMLPNEYMDGQFELKYALDKLCIKVHYISYTNICEVESIDGQMISLYECEAQQILEVLSNTNVAIFHSCTIIPAIKIVADNLNRPYIASLYATESSTKPLKEHMKYFPNYIHSDSLLYANKWINKIDCTAVCIRSHIPTEFYSERSKSRNLDRIRIAISGTVQERKGQLEAIKAIALLKDIYDIELFIYGYNHFFKEYMDLCIELIEMENLSDSVHFMGFVRNISKDLIDREIDIMLCASRFESFPQVIQEAMASEITVVSTPVGGVPELIVDGVTGYLTNDFTSKEISKAINRCIVDFHEDTGKKISKKAKNVVTSVSSKEAVIKSLTDLYLFTYYDIDNHYISGNSETKQDESYSLEQTMVSVKPKIEYDRIVASPKIMMKKKYTINVINKRISSISIVVGTHAKKVQGTVTLYIHSPKYFNHVIRSSVCDLNKVNDNDWVTFYFDELQNIEKKDLIIEFHMDYNDKDYISIYEHKNSYNKLYFMAE